MKMNHGVSRRRFVASGMALASTLQLQRAAWALGLGAEAEVCKLTPEQEVGPFYVANERLRSDIREGKPGVPLTLKIAVLDSRTCKPLADAAVDVWSCDAMGLYAGFTASNPMGGGPGGPPPDGGPPPGFDPSRQGPPNGGPPPGGGFGENKPTDELTFLRGVQITDARGAVEFATVFPGFYMGRTNHVHFKVRLGGEIAEKEHGRTYVAGHTSHVGQVFFPEELAAELMKLDPYASHKIHRTTQKEDGPYTHQHGDLCVARVVWVEPGNAAAGLRAELIASVDPTAIPAPVGGFGMRGRGGPPPRS